MVEGGGFEPPKAICQQIYSLPRLTRLRYPSVGKERRQRTQECIASSVHVNGNHVRPRGARTRAGSPPRSPNRAADELIPLEPKNGAGS